MTGEIFPLKVRAKALSMTTATNWLLNWAIAYSTPYLVNWGKGNANLQAKIFFIWFGSCFLCITFVYFMIYETKGLTLEQVDELYDEVKSARKSVHWSVPRFLLLSLILVLFPCPSLTIHSPSEIPPFLPFPLETPHKISSLCLRNVEIKIRRECNLLMCLIQYRTPTTTFRTIRASMGQQGGVGSKEEGHHVVSSSEKTEGHAEYRAEHES